MKDLQSIAKVQKLIGITLFRRIPKIKEVREMEKYINPEIEVVELQVNDIITSSPGTETPPYEENDGIWDLSIG